MAESKYTREMHNDLQAILNLITPIKQTNRVRPFLSLTYGDIVPPSDSLDASKAFQADVDAFEQQADADEQLARWVAEQAIALLASYTRPGTHPELSDTAAVEWTGKVLATARAAVRAEKAEHDERLEEARG